MAALTLSFVTGRHNKVKPLITVEINPEGDGRGPESLRLSRGCGCQLPKLMERNSAAGFSLRAGLIQRQFSLQGIALSGRRSDQANSSTDRSLLRFSRWQTTQFCAACYEHHPLDRGQMLATDDLLRQSMLEVRKRPVSS